MNNFIDTEQNITALELNSFEQEQNVNLPVAYKTHILTSNGGTPEKDIFKGMRVHYFHPIKYGENQLKEIIDDIGELFPPDFFPFAGDAGGNQIGFFLAGERVQKVYIWFHDMDDEDELEYLADSFEEFMEGLTDKDDY